MHRYLRTTLAAAALSGAVVACGAPQPTDTTEASQDAPAESGEAEAVETAAAPQETTATTRPVATTEAGIVPPPTITDPGPQCTPTEATSTQDVETSSFAAGDEQAAQTKNQVLVLRDLQMCAGRPHLFVGGHAATVSTPMSWGVDVRCTRQDDAGTAEQQSLRRSTLSTRSHNGDGRQKLAVRWVFTPDRNGVYDCELRSWGRVPSGRGTMQVVPDEDTVLRVSGVEPGAVEWRQESDAYLCDDDPDDAGCARSAELLRREVEVTGEAESIDVYAGVEASVCTTGYKRCTAGTSGDGHFTIRTRLIATQVTGPGSTKMCAGAQAHVRDLTIQVPGGGELDHTKIHSPMENPVPVVRGGDCSPTFVVRVIAEYQQTNPAGRNHGGVVESVIPDGDAGDADALNRAYTSAYVLQNS